MYKAVIFDFFGVISSEVSVRWYRKHFNEEEAVRLQEEINPLMDAGKMSLGDYFSELGTKANLSVEEVKKEYDSLTSINENVISIIEVLREKHIKIALCSNATAEFLRPILNSHSLNRLFDVDVISSEVGFIKPDPEIFKKTLALLGVEAKGTIFIDDNVVNVESARTLGITGIHFTSDAELKKELSALGL